jgi:hypothetical protein
MKFFEEEAQNMKVFGSTFMPEKKVRNSGLSYLPG